ncbi:MAG: cysteine desulfurase family protein [Gemmatimonadetes bacterium]|nr:cysteine desulfurase family protein [Gemmatimonadota bacterium]
MNKPIYLDNAATTPIRPEVLQAMMPYLTDEAFGNPSSMHQFGRAAQAGVDTARRQIAEAFGTEPGDVIFTSGGTEADNLAIIGGALASHRRGGPFRVAVGQADHKAVLAAAEAVEQAGGEALYLPVDSNCLLRADAVQEALASKLAVFSMMWVNNEIGVIQDVRAVAEQCAATGAVFHTDAVQAVGKVPCRIDDFPCTLLSISGHKIGAPKGVGALLVRDRTVVDALIHGGGQQFGIRPGTENVAGIVALGQAVRLAVREQETTHQTLGALRDDFERRMRETFPDAKILAADADRAPHISNLSLPGIDSQALLMQCDMAGVALSAGSACNTGAAEPSHVHEAMGLPTDVATGAVRFSFYKQNTPQDVNRVMEILPGIVEKVKKLAEVLAR